MITPPMNRETGRFVDSAVIPQATLLESIPDGLLVIDDSGTIRLANPSVEFSFKYKEGELIGLSISDVLPAEAVEPQTKYTERFFSEFHDRSIRSALRMSAIRKDLTAFPVEVSFAPIELDGRRLVGAFIRDTTAATRVELLLLAINRVNRALLANLNPREIYALIAGEGRMLLGGALGTVVVPGHRPGLMVIAGAANEDFGYLVGLELDPGSSAAGRAIDSGQTIRIADLALSGNVHSDGSSLGLGPAIIVPIAADETCIGALSIVRKAGQIDFSDDEQSLAESFAKTVAVAIVSDMTRGELAVSNLIRDKIRIAEDLDNVVMTNLGDIGTRLNGIRERVQDGISTKIRMAIADIEEVAAELSNAIDGLSNGALKTTPVLHRIVELLERESSELGFKPVLSVDGPLDNLVSPELRDAILHAIDQIILNIACHSMATWATVDIHADSLSLVISICDDGIGIPAGPASARWINRLAARAQQHGGEFSAMEKIPIGCLYEWRVPLPT